MTENPELNHRAPGCVAHEPFEALCGIMTFFELTLREVEVLNEGLPMHLRVGLKPGRINISRIEHEFCNARVAIGHSVLTGVALERYWKRRIAQMMMTNQCPDGMFVKRADYEGAGLE